LTPPADENEAIVLAVPGLHNTARLYVHGPRDKFVSQTLRDTRQWEPYETSLVLDILQPGYVFVDVGANLGYFTVVAGHALGDAGQVIAIEPDPANYALLQANIELNGLTERCIAHEVGLSDSNCSGNLYMSADNLGDHQIYAAEANRASLPISLCHGGDFLRPGVDRIDLLKIDTQGSEFAVMTGLMPLLKELPGVPQILVELTPYSLREARSSGRALILLLKELNQRFWIVDHVEHQLVESSAEELAAWCDAVDACQGDRGFMNILVGPGLGRSTRQ